MSHSTLEISRSKLLHNYNYFKSKTQSETKILVLVKANGYGHGDVEIAQLVQEFGANYLGVAYPSEALRLKNAGIKLPIMVLTPGYDNFDLIVNQELEPSIVDLESALKLVEAVKKARKKSYPIHIKVDTGMHRVGFDLDSADKLIDFLNQNCYVSVKSVFTHLAASEDINHDEFTRNQVRVFNDFYKKVTCVLLFAPIKHVLNSSGIERFPEYQYDMVRLGIGIYGINYTKPDTLRPVGSLKAPIVQIKKVTDSTVGYGRKGVVNGEKMIATLPLGYADGINRHLGRGKVKFEVNGKLVPTIGNICMDMFMIDVTGVDVKCGDIVTIFGESVSSERLAKALGTISYEIFTSVSARIKRVIVD